MTTKTFSHALGEIGDKYVSEAISYTFSKKKNGWMKWAAMVACLCLVVLVGIKMGTRDNFIPLNINTITNASYSAPAITSTIESVQVTEDDVNAWLGFDLRSNLPKEIKDFTMKYYLVRDSKIDETLGVEVWGKVEDAEIPRPQFHIAITEGKVLEDLLFDYDVTTDIDGVTVIAGVMPGEYKTKRDGEVVWQPARYFSLFDVGVYHCAVETDGMISEEAFSQLINVLVDCMLDMIENHLDRSTIDRVSSDETEKAEMSKNTGGGTPLAPEEMEEDTEDIVGNVSHMIIQSGKSGQRKSLKDTDSVQQIMADIKYLNYKKMQPMEEVEYAYSITFFNEAYEELGIIYILDDSGLEIVYEGYVYLIEPDVSINIASIAEELLKDAPPAEPEEPEENKSIIVLPSSVKKVEVSGYYNGSVINAGDFVVKNFDMFTSWISQLSLEHRTFEKGKNPSEMYAGGDSYTFDINDGALTFTYAIGGSPVTQYFIYDEEWYEVLNPSELPFE